MKNPKLATNRQSYSKMKNRHYCHHPTIVIPTNQLISTTSNNYSPISLLKGDNDVDEYVPPPAVVVGGREQRGKSPVTPSYRRPPPYVSP